MNTNGVSRPTPGRSGREGPLEEDAPSLSVVLPVHDERENLAPLVDEIRRALAGRRFEIVAVDDGSQDGSLAELRRLAGRERRLRVLVLRRRGGQSGAVAAGWSAARGAVVVTLDADGQNDPADVPRLLAALDEDAGLTAAVGVRTARGGAWKRLQSRVANRVRDAITGHRVTDSACGLRAVRREALAGLARFDGMHRFVPTLVVLAGGRVREIPVHDRPRRHGHTKYGMWNRAWRGLRDALGVRWLAARRLHAEAEELP
jgi:glycosyltransferase involved in cell wall biosynthesis